MMLLSLFLSWVPLQAADTAWDDLIGISWSIYLQKKQFSCVVPEKTILETPKWDPEAAPPPVSIPTAIKLARGWLAKALPTAHEWKVERIECAQYGTTGRWFYEVTISSGSLNHKEDDYPRIPVLMNGQLGVIKSVR
jgi:hypothetical protein